MRDYLSTQLDVDYDELVRLWTKGSSKKLVQCLIDDMFCNLMAWSINRDTTNTHLEEELTRILDTQLPASPTKDHLRKHHNAIKNIVKDVHTHIDPLYTLIVETVSDIVDENPWRIWHLKMYSTNVYIERDEDYRIMVFNEKVEAGEWSIGDR